jgi:hypothetical protein
MPVNLPQIADVLIAPDAPTGGVGPISLGLRLAGGAAHWGDVALPDGVDQVEALAAAHLLRERLAPALSGRRLDSLRDFSGRVREAAGDSLLGEALRPAWQAAWLEAFRAAPDAAQRLRREYAFPADAPPNTPPAGFLEISDHAATAERIDGLLALRPAGLGYRLTGGRVTEAIGPNAEHLQRFVRELGRRAATLAPGENYRPAMYLALNGALGELAGDPVRHIGKVLGNVVGLQTAAGERRLILEAPFRLDDPLAQAANLHRLKEFIRRTPDSLKRAAPTLLVAPLAGAGHEAQVYADTAAVNALVCELPSGDFDWTLAELGRAGAAGLATYWRLPSAATPRQAALAVFLAGVAGSAAVIVSGDSGATLPTFVIRLLAEQAVATVNPLTTDAPSEP